MLEGRENKSQVEEINQSHSLQESGRRMASVQEFNLTIAKDNSDASNSLFSKSLRLLLKVKDE